MIEQINIELLKLQDELQKLKSASEQIAQAGKLSKDVLEMGQNLTESYGDVLKKLQSLVSDYMNKTYKVTEENLTKLFVSFQERVKEEEEILTKFSELSAQSEDILKKVLDQILTRGKKQIDELVAQIKKTLDEQKKMLDSHTKASSEAVQDLAKKHEQTLEQEQQILESYLDLAEKTAKLSKVISDINFPKRLDAIDAKLASLNNRISDTEKELKQTTAEQTDQLLTKISQVLLAQEELYERVEKNRKKIVGNKILLWIIFIINLLFYGAATYIFLQMFSDFFQAMSK
jgi:hypothetical protein